MGPPVDLQVFAHVQQIAGNLRLEQEQRTNAENALSNRLDITNARLDARVDGVERDLQQERDARTASENAVSNRLDTTNARLDDIKEEFDGQLAAIQKEIEKLEHLIAYFEYCAFAKRSPFHELLERIGITTVEQLRGKEPEQLHSELSRIAAQEPHYQAVPAVQRRRVTEEIIRWSRSPGAPSGDGGRPATSPGRR